jgi:diguanylate cyclase (GGDEF)-like protein
MSGREPSASGVHTSRFPKRRVLIVDDDPGFTLLAEETLRQATFEVKTASSVEAGRVAFESFIPDMVLLDIELPDGNGLQLCRHIRSAASNSDIPVVLVTGHDDTVSIEKGYEAGASDFLQKPVLWPTLPHRVDYMLRASQDGRALARSEKKNRALLEALPDASVVVDGTGCIVEHLLGIDTDGNLPLIGRPVEEAFPTEIALEARRLLRKVPDGPSVSRFARVRGGKRRWFEARFLPQSDGHLLIVSRDITQQLKAEARIKYLAYYDALTGLPNRQLFLIKAQERLARGGSQGYCAAVFFLDLDRFKRINDNLGHALGDTLLKLVSERLQHQLKNGSDTTGSMPKVSLVARLGGDKFALYADGLKDEQQTGALADNIRAALDAPFDFAEHKFVVTASVGVAVYPGDSDSLDDLLVKAEMAMYLAKEQGRNGHAFFGQSMALRSLRRLSMETDLRRALENGDFRIHYQPKLNLANGEITGVEALLRWPHAEKGMIGPDKFIPVAEETGLIIPLGAWVLSETCAQLGRWAANGLGHITAAVNVSAQQFMRRDFVDSVLSVLRAARVNGQRLELEITESMLMRHLDESRVTLNRLRAAGVALSIDDFGTGYSSLGYLRSLPVSALKIDRSFVKDLGRHEDAAAICAAIIAMARELKIEVVAEGVENQKQLDFLHLQHCEQAQGFLIAKPAAAEEVEPLLRGGGTRRWTLGADAALEPLIVGASRGVA